MEEDFCDAAEFEARVAAEIIRPTDTSLAIIEWANRHYPPKLLNKDKRWCNWEKDGLPFYAMLMARLVVEEAMEREAASGRKIRPIPESELHLARDVAEFEASVAACAAKHVRFPITVLGDEHKYWFKHLYCRLHDEGEMSSWYRWYIPPSYILRKICWNAGTAPK